MIEKVVLLTGGGAGVGLALAERLGRRGFRVLVAEQLAGDPVASVRAQGRLDLLVHAAEERGEAVADDLDVALASHMLERNVLAPIALTRALWPDLVAARGGVITVSSALGTYAQPGAAAYAASKHALTAWSRTLRISGLRDGVGVLTVNPGATTPPGRCADTALRALERRRAELWCEPADRLRAAAQSIAPGLFARHA